MRFYVIVDLYEQTHRGQGIHRCVVRDGGVTGRGVQTLDFMHPCSEVAIVRK